MLARLPKTARRRTVAADKAYDTKGFVADARALGFTPHVAQNTKVSAIDGRTTRHAGHVVSQRIRKRIEEPFGRTKTIGGGRQLRYRGQQRNRAWFKMTIAEAIRREDARGDPYDHAGQFFAGQPCRCLARVGGSDGAEQGSRCWSRQEQVPVQ